MQSPRDLKFKISEFRRWVAVASVVVANVLELLNKSLGAAGTVILLTGCVVQVSLARNVGVLKAVRPTAELAGNGCRQRDQICDFRFQMSGSGKPTQKVEN